jgi:ABC-type multidrug transport system fused ATPase/permease subunit
MSIALGICYGIICMLAQALVPAVISRAIDNGIIARDRQALILWGGVVLSLAAVQAVTSIMRDRCAVANRLSASFRALQFVTRQATRLGATLPKRMSTGDVVNVGVADITQVGSAIASTSRGAGAIASVAVIGAIMLTTSWKLGLVVLVGVPVIAWATAWLIRPLYKRQQRVLEQQGALTSRAIDIVNGLRVLRGIGGERVFLSRYCEDSQRVRTTAVELARVEAWLGGAGVLMPGILTVSVVWFGAQYLQAGQLSAGQLVAFYGYAAFMVVPLNWLTETADSITRGLASAGRIIGLLALEPALTMGSEVSVPQEPATLSDPQSGLSVEPGRLTAVVCSHADAVTLADRLGHFTDAGVTYGKIPLGDLRLDDVRRRILVVDNDARLFAGPLRTELDPTDQGRDAEYLWKAALDAASARDIVEGLPDGLDGEIVEWARNFSGGQQQRLRLVRALMVDPDVLLLVDPTNSVDTHTEARIAQGLATARAGRTTVVFTTSPIVLDHADHVFLVEDTKVTATGTHASLLTNARYRSIVTREVGAL